MKKKIRDIEYELLLPGEKDLPGPEESIDKIRAYAKDDPWALVREASLNDEDESPDPLTDLGTRCSRAWDADWIAIVNAAEARLGHRICGARTPNGTLCTPACPTPPPSADSPKSPGNAPTPTSNPNPRTYPSPKISPPSTSPTVSCAKQPEPQPTAKTSPCSPHTVHAKVPPSPRMQSATSSNT